MYIFIGLIYPEEERERILKNSKVGLESAANNYQWALIKGMFIVNGERLKILNSIPMGTYPKYNKILFEKGRTVQAEEAEIISFSYLNLPLIKQIMREKSIYKALKNILNNTTEQVNVIVYSLYNPYLKALAKLKRKFKNLNYTLVVTDLPGNLGLESSEWLRRALNRLLGKNSLEISSFADAYILLTEQMKEPLRVGDKPYTIIEGIYGTESSLREEYKKGDKPVILYTGALEKTLGLDVLLEAFERLPENAARLCLAGYGGYLEEIKACAKKNENIEYLGYLSKEEVTDLQNSAAILVNPRSQEEEFVKYSFPSKTMEYLATGVPVVMNRLPGIPKEYEEHIFYTENSTAKALAEAITNVLNIDDNILLNHGRKAAAFIFENKNSEAQAKKTVELIDKL